MDDAELCNVVGAKITGAVGYMGGMLSRERLKAEQYYRGEKFGDEIKGQSQVVSRDVAEAVDGALPALMKIFASSDNLGEFTPRQPKPDLPGQPPGSGAKRAENEAQQATDYINKIFWVDNDGFIILHNWFKDALLKKLGIVKSWWDDETDTTKETYEGLTDTELAMLRLDPEIEVVSDKPCDDPDTAHAIQAFAPAQVPPQQPPQPSMQPPGMSAGGEQSPAPQLEGASPVPLPPPAPMPVPLPQLHDVVVRRTKSKGRIRIMAVPPDEFLIDHRAVDLEEAPFKAHRRKATVSELIEMGFDRDLVEGLGSDNAQDFNPEVIERFKEEDAYPYRSDNFVDPSMREIWVTECYLRIDYDGDGIAELRKVTLAGESNFDLLENEEVDDHPFSTLTPVPMPHKVFGMSMADQTEDIQEIKSALWRGMLNSLYLQNAPRYGIIDGKVNLDDLLDVRPGAAVRMKSPDAVVPLATVPVSDVVFQAVEYADNVRESRTGIRRFNSTLNPDQLNPYSTTATGARLVEDASKDRLLLIARIFAQTGVTNLFRRLLELVCKHQQAPELIRMRGKWSPMDPREWSDEMDMTISVGLGSGDKSAEMARAMALAPFYTQVIQLQGGIQGPLITATNLYNYGKKLVQISELKETDLYITDPTGQPPIQHPPDPKTMLAQAQVAALQAKTQIAGQAAQAKTQSDAQKGQQEMQLLAAKHQMDIQQAQEKSQLDARHEADQAASEQAIERARLAHDLAIQQAQTASRMALETQESHNDMALARMKFEEEKRQGKYKPRPNGAGK